MKTLIILAAILLSATMAFAELTDGPCYNWELDPVMETSGRQRVPTGELQLIVNTGAELLDRYDVVFGNKDLEKNANDIGKTLYGQLKEIKNNGLPIVSAVVMSARQISIRIYPYPNVWVEDPKYPNRKPVLDDVLGIVEKVLCAPE